MPLADSEGLGAAEQRESRRGALRMRGDRNEVHGLLGQVAKVLKYQGVGWGLFKNIRDPKYLSAVDFNFRQNLMESDCLKLNRFLGHSQNGGLESPSPRPLTPAGLSAPLLVPRDSVQYKRESPL